MTMKKTISLLLSLLLCLGSVSVLASCSESKENADQGAEGSPAPSSDVGTVTPEETETEFIDPFAGEDFGGREFRVYTSVDDTDATNGNAFIQGSGELNGEAVNDAVFERNAKVCDLLNISLSFIEASLTYSNHESTIKNQIMAGADEWDVMANDIMAFGSLARDGYLHNIYSNKILDLDQSYWYGDAMRDCQFIEGGMYILIGDYFTDALQSAHALYSNKNMINDHFGDPNYLQNMVFDGKWTFDQMIDVINTVKQDTDGDGTMKEGDLFGFTCIGMWGSMIPFLIGTDIQFVERTDEGIQYCFNNERSVKILEKLNELFYADGALTTLADYSDAGLIDLIHDSISSPFPVAFNGTLGGFMLSSCFSSPLSSHSTDFASAYAKSTKVAMKSLEKASNAFLANLENGN